jgi:hypothetical protein
MTLRWFMGFEKELGGGDVKGEIVAELAVGF